MIEEFENIDSQNDETEELDSTNETVDQEDESTDEDKPEYTEREKQLYARAKKAEAALKENKPVEKKKEAQTGNLSTLDIIALSKADIDDTDLDEVLDYAKYKGISVKEALNSSVLKATLSQKAEERNSAQAVNTGSTRRGSSIVSDERLLSDARKNIMPEKEGDLERLAILRIKNR